MRPGVWPSSILWVFDRLVQISVVGLSSLSSLIGSPRRPHSPSRFLLRRTEAVVRLGSSSPVVANVAVVGCSSVAAHHWFRLRWTSFLALRRQHCWSTGFTYTKHLL